MPRRWWALVAVSLATFMTYLDNNVTNVAIPTIQRDLHLSVAGLEWVVSSYILVFAGLLLAGGRLADVFGRRRLFVTGLSVFTLASLGAGLAGSGAELIGFRLAQGLGAALLVPTTLAILVATFDNLRERATAIGVWTRHRRRRARGRPADRRLHQPALPLGLDLLHQRAGRRDHPGPGPGHGERVAGHQRRAAARPARPGDLGGDAVRADLRADRGARQGLDVRPDPRLVRASARWRPGCSPWPSRAARPRW